MIGLQLQDLYTAGIGFDLGGAFLLARGLINSPAELSRLSGTYFDFNKFQAISVAKNRLDAVAGVSGLGAGFILQAVGYVTLVSRPHSTRTGLDEAFVAAAFALLTLGATVLLGSVYQRRGLTPLLVEMAHWKSDDHRLPFPRAIVLPSWIATLGYERREGEDDLAFVRRVARVENLVVEVKALPGNNETRRRLWTDPPLEGE